VVLEVLSTSNLTLDRETKFEEYAQAGIPEYWMANPKTERVSLFALEGRAYRLIGHFGRGERVPSIVLDGFEVSVDDLFG
jgi:Uma2 family endonuclease